MNRQRKLLTEEVERVEDSRAEDAQPWETGGQPRRHSCLTLMVELMEMVELKDAQPWETGASRGVTPA